MCAIVASGVPPQALEQARLRLKTGGLGIRFVEDVADVAFLGCANECRATLRMLLGKSEDDLLVTLSSLGAVQMRIEVESARNSTMYGELDTEISRQVDVDLA